MSHHTLSPPQLILYGTEVKSFIGDHHVEDDQLLGRDDYSLAGQNLGGRERGGEIWEGGRERGGERQAGR